MLDYLLSAGKKVADIFKKGRKDSKINLLWPNPVSIDRKLTFFLIISALILLILLFYYFYLAVQISNFETEKFEPLLKPEQEQQLKRELENINFWLNFSAAEKALSAICLPRLLLAADDILGEESRLHEISYQPGELILKGQTADIQSYNNIIHRLAVWRSQGFEIFLERTGYFASPEFKLILLEVGKAGND